MVITLKKKKYNFKNTLSDERLIGNYKDEIDIEISNEFEYFRGVAYLQAVRSTD